MNEKVKILINALKEMTGDKKLDLNKEPEERKARIKLLKESFEQLISVLNEGQEDEVNINEKMDEISKQFGDFRISKVEGMNKILPATYEEDILTIPEISEVKVVSDKNK